MSERTVVHLLRHGEVHNPEKSSTAGCPATGSPTLGRADGRAGRASAFAGRDVARSSSSPLERARQTAAPIAEALGLDVHDRRAADRGRERLRGPAGRRRRRRRCGPPALVVPAQPVPARPGGSPTAESRCACTPPSRWRARPRAGTRPCSSATSCPIWIARLSAEHRRLWHDPRRRQCSLASRHVVHLRGRPAGVHRATPSPPADLLPRGQPGARRMSRAPRRRPHVSACVAGLRSPACRAALRPARRVLDRLRRAAADAARTTSAGRRRRVDGRRAADQRADARRAAAARRSTGEQVDLGRATRPRRRAQRLGLVVRALPQEAPGAAGGLARTRAAGRPVPRASTSARTATRQARRPSSAPYRHHLPAACSTRAASGLLALRGAVPPNAIPSTVVARPRRAGSRPAISGATTKARPSSTSSTTSLAGRTTTVVTVPSRSHGVGQTVLDGSLLLARADRAGRRPGVVPLARACCRSCPATSATSPAFRRRPRAAAPRPDCSPGAALVRRRVHRRLRGARLRRRRPRLRRCRSTAGGSPACSACVDHRPRAGVPRRRCRCSAASGGSTSARAPGWPAPRCSAPPSGSAGRLHRPDARRASRRSRASAATPAAARCSRPPTASASACRSCSSRSPTGARSAPFAAVRRHRVLVTRHRRRAARRRSASCSPPAPGSRSWRTCRARSPASSR